MHEDAVARRYAAALFSQAQRTNRLDQAAGELKLVAQSVKQSPMLAAVISQPLLTQERQKAALKDVFVKSISPQTLGFLSLLVDKRRIALLPEVIAEFQQMVRTFHNVEEATATTAVTLTEAERTALVRSLEARTGKKIELNTAVDPEVLGGVLVRIGDTVFDGTVRGKLGRLREQLVARR